MTSPILQDQESQDRDRSGGTAAAIGGLPPIHFKSRPAAPPSACEAKAALRIQPLEDLRWDEFVDQHPRSSVFHSSAWLRALLRTYGYRCFAYTTSPPGRMLENAIVFCAVESWLTGKRLVSLPFSDHCEPLVDHEDDWRAMAAAIDRQSQNPHWRYLELRPLRTPRFFNALPHATIPYRFHKLDLSPDLDTLFRNLHKDSIQRKIRRAEREGLLYREGRSEALLDEFYGMFKLTRQRLRVPPQPRRWFANLMQCFGDDLKIRLACTGEGPIAAMITIRHKQTLFYKYGCSDSRFHNLGGMHLLYWSSIREAKNEGLRHFDLGRSNADQAGLITFKNRWGAAPSELNYSRYGAEAARIHVFDLPAQNWKARAAKSMLAHVPASVFSRIGQILYGHAG
jgi:CelD/BcsL family acetyltransferase involved in cellulose biosynthesis